MSLYTEMEDLNGIADYMLQQSWLEESGLVLAGKSLGGTVAALVAAKRPEDVGGLILHYPYFILSESLGGDGKTGIVDNVFDVISAFHGDVLIFNGDQDKYVPLEFTEKAAEAYDHAELVVVEGSGHGFGGTDRLMVKQKMTDYIRKLQGGTGNDR